MNSTIDTAIAQAVASTEKGKARKTLDLTTPESALAYLRSLPADTEISLPGPHESTPEGDAVTAISGCSSANEWARNCNRWDWTAGELVSALS